MQGCVRGCSCTHQTFQLAVVVVCAARCLPRSCTPLWPAAFYFTAVTFSGGMEQSG
uniref:Uncharacterized protein n=1 Tax=Setaria italica TaxID=4555 RepID=K4APE9_SETIT